MSALGVHYHEIELASGAYLDLSAPTAVMTLADIATGLSHLCRFSGQCRRFYSVAEHACLVARYLEAQAAPRHVILGGLHHDDAEAFTGDLTRPLKMLLPGYREIEAAVAAAVGVALGLPVLDAAEAAIVKDADDWALAAEAYYLLPSRGVGWYTAKQFDPAADYGLRTSPLGLPPKRAAAAFRDLHDSLAPETVT